MRKFASLMVMMLIVVLLFSSIPLQPTQNSLAGDSGKASVVSAINETHRSANTSGLVAGGSRVRVSNVSLPGYSQGYAVPGFFSYGTGYGGVGSGAVNTEASMRYPSIFPYNSGIFNNTYSYFYPPIFQNASTYEPPFMYQGNSQYESAFATSLHWAANFTRIYPPGIDYFTGNKNASGGLGPGYSLQFNVPFFSSVPGGTSLNWYQSVFEFYTISGTGNSSDSNASYVFIPNSVWWLNFSKMYFRPYSFNYSNYDNLFVNSEYPLLFSSWLNISFVQKSVTNGSVFITESDRVTGFLANGGRSDIPYSDHRYRTVWFNTTFEILNGSKNGVDPFPVFLMNNGQLINGVTSTASGIAFVGSGNGQMIWGNYTATFGVAQDMGGTLLPMSGVEATQSGTGETSEGDEGVVITGAATNPLGLPPYFPYVFDSYQPGGPLGNHEYNMKNKAVGSSLITGNVFPSNATITAYSIYTRSYVPVVKNSSSFYVDFPDLYGMNSSNIIIGGLSLDYWSPIILNFSLQGFQSSSVIISPYHEQNPFVEIRSVRAVLAPLNQKMVYGFISFPMSYFAYLANGYVSSHFPDIGSLKGSIYGNFSSVANAYKLLNDVWGISASVSSFLWLNVTGNNGYYNNSMYLSYVTQSLLQTLWGPYWINGRYSSVAVFSDLFFSDSIRVPYYVLTSSSSNSVGVSAPLLSSRVSVPFGVGAFEENISLGSFDVPLKVNFISMPESYDGAPPSISSVSMDGRTVWSGSSGNVNTTIDVPLANLAASDVSDLITCIYNNTYSPGYPPSHPWTLSLPSFYYNATFTVAPSSTEYAPVNVSSNMMVFNYSLYMLALRQGTGSANVSQMLQFQFPKVQVGIGGSYYGNVRGYIYGVYNLTGQKFVLGGVNLNLIRNGISIGTATTDSGGYYDFNFTMGPDSAWGYNRTIEVVMSATDMQFTDFSDVLYIHANSSVWFNGSMTFISTVNLLGYNATVPFWLFEDIGGTLLAFTDAGIYIVIIYFGAVIGIGLAGATAGGGIMYVIIKKMLKTAVVKGAGTVKNTANQIKPKG